MKRRLLVLLVISLVSLSLGAGKAAAQARSRVQVPFDFIVGNQLLPADSYFVTRISPHVICLTSQRTSVSSVVNRHWDEKTETPSLVFIRIGREYFLAEVWFGKTAGLKVPQSDRLKESLRAVADTPGKRVVALR